MNDELKKLGLRIRPRIVERRVERRREPGRIAFDDRGNAVYQWNNDRLCADGEDGDRARRDALDHPGLSLAEEEPAHNAPIRNNTKGLRVGYDPYESGLLPKKQWKKQRDLRELSRWLEMKRRLSQDE